MTLHMHSHLRPWTDAACVVDSYRLYGQRCRAVSEQGWEVVGVFTQMTDGRWASFQADGKTLAMRPVLIEVLP